jgi:hypothetical protein
MPAAQLNNEPLSVKRMRGKTPRVEPGWTPELELRAEGGRCRLSLVGVTYGNGETLQEAGNDLLVRLFDLAVAFRDGRHRMETNGGRGWSEVMEFLWEIGEIAARGGDIRGRVFGVPEQRTPSD